jgi:hypothetical protein
MTDQPKKKGGRPSKYTPEIVSEICARLSEGETLHEICRSAHMPSVRVIYDWIAAKPDVSALIARARDIGYDAIAQQAYDIANTPITGDETEIDADGNVSKIKRRDMLEHRRLQIETRLKLLAKWSPRYRERLQQEVSGPGGGPIQTEDVGARELLAARLASLMRSDG